MFQDPGRVSVSFESVSDGNAAVRVRIAGII